MKLGGPGPASTLMFAKFSPDGGRVGWVRYAEYNLYVEDITGGKITQLTRDGSRTALNGTFDWGYEEELRAQDGWRWNSHRQSIADWQLARTGVRGFPRYKVTHPPFPLTDPLQIPQT